MMTSAGAYAGDGREVHQQWQEKKQRHLRIRRTMMITEGPARLNAMLDMLDVASARMDPDA
jgi:hypothetical protein